MSLLIQGHTCLADSSKVGYLLSFGIAGATPWVSLSRSCSPFCLQTSLPPVVRRRACFSASLTLSQPPCRNTRQRAHCGCCDFARVSQPRGKSNPLDKAVLCSWGRAFPCNPDITFVFKSNIEHENNRPLISTVMGGKMNAPINLNLTR